MRWKMGSKKTSNSSNNRIFFCFLLPGLLGLLLWYFIPYVLSVIYSFTDTSGEFSGLTNYEAVVKSTSFRTAVENTVAFMLLSVSLNLLIPMGLALLYRQSQKHSFLLLAFLLPLVIPSGAVVYFWRIIFSDFGVINKLLYSAKLETIHFFAEKSVLWVVLLIFLMKNVGFNMVLFVTALGQIPHEIYELAEVEGGSRFFIFRKVTLVYLLPTIFVGLLMSIINSFKSFREIYLLFGSYPSPRVYMLQHYINNLFAAADLQKLSAVSILISVCVVTLISFLYIIQQNKYSAGKVGSK